MAEQRRLGSMKAAPDTSTNQATPRQPTPQALRRDAHAWVRRLASGEATVADAQALKHWCETSEAHATAFAEARRLWRELGPAGEAVRRRQAGAARRAPRIGRRAFLGGAIATAAGAAVAVVAPAGLLSAFPSLAADLHTATGEQRQVALAPGVTVDLNTRTSVALRRAAGVLQGVDLLGGEIAVDNTRGAAQPFVVAAGEGQAIATRASLEVRDLGQHVCVTCVSGRVRVELGSRGLGLVAGQQVTYDKRVLGAPVQADANIASAWRSGVLVFRDTPLAEVVDEINRYRAGHVVVVDGKLSRSRLNGRFRINQLEAVFAQIQEVLGASVTRLPGGIVLLG